MEALHDLSASLDESIAGNRRLRDDEDEISDDSDFDPDYVEGADEEDALFGEVRRHGQSGSAQQRQLYAILEAVRPPPMSLIFVSISQNLDVEIFLRLTKIYINC
jgi:hypothetical protein